MTNVKVDRKGVLSSAEFTGMVRKSDQPEYDEYSSLRAKAIISLFRGTGKRRSEVASLEMDDIQIQEPNLNVTFTVVKKRKKSVIANRRPKAISLKDPLVQHILEYWHWMKIHHPECRYLFPSIRTVFGAARIFYKDKHLSGRQILRIVKDLNPESWCHLFRETVGAEVVQKDPSLIGVFKVMLRLDLERESTAWNYMRRHAIDVISQERK